MKPLKELNDLMDRPSTMNGPGLKDTREERLTELNDNQVVMAYKVPWAPDGFHLDDATPDVEDSVWGVQDGQRAIRQLKTIKEIKRG
jgi:hypothetical protein